MSMLKYFLQGKSKGAIDMAEILEAVMLMCFGFSWPISVIRNIRARTAKSMSLGFILLIIVGYIAGIGAKIYTRNYGYVLIVYFLNLMAVSANLAVYFINRMHDRRREMQRQPEVCYEQ